MSEIGVLLVHVVWDSSVFRTIRPKGEGTSNLSQSWLVAASACVHRLSCVWYVNSVCGTLKQLQACLQVRQIQCENVASAAACLARLATPGHLQLRCSACAPCNALADQVAAEVDDSLCRCDHRDRRMGPGQHSAAAAPRRSLCAPGARACPAARR